MHQVCNFRLIYLIYTRMHWYQYHNGHVTVYRITLQYIILMIQSINFNFSHRYTPEIPESAPSWSRHGAQIGGLWVFLIIKIIVVNEAVMLPVCTWSEREDNHAFKAAWHAKIVNAFVFRLLLRVWSAKTRRLPNWSPWLMTPLHGAV